LHLLIDDHMISDSSWDAIWDVAGHTHTHIAIKPNGYMP